MAREWKSGDVAMRIAGERRHVCVRVPRCTAAASGLRDEPHWHFASKSPGTTAQCGSDALAEYRPLVVIDPEDREQAKELIRLFWANGNDACDDTRAMQAALREFANPPPPIPDEPGVWSVAIVANNVPFMRAAQAHITPPIAKCWFGEHPTTGERVRLSWAALHDLGDVRVVNEAAS
jgi:hypothetical protein